MRSLAVGLLDVGLSAMLAIGILEIVVGGILLAWALVRLDR
jgi:hypothetical protein